MTVVLRDPSQYTQEYAIQRVDIDRAADEAARAYRRMMEATGKQWNGRHGPDYLPTEDELIEHVRRLVAVLIRDGSSWISSGGIDVRVAIREGPFGREDGKPGYAEALTLYFTCTLGSATGLVVHDHPPRGRSA